MSSTSPTGPRISVDEAFQALRAAGVDTVPGTGVKVLSERVRQIVAPGDLEVDRWIQTIEAAHDAGFRSTSVLFYGHVETAAERIAHLRTLRRLQERRHGFTEFVPIPLPGFGVSLVPDRAPVDEHRAMVAVSRLLLAGSIRHIQIPWTRHGRDLAVTLLRAGGDDLGGTLLDGRVLPEAGAEHGLEFPFAEAERAVGRIFRSLRRRTTDYREPVASGGARVNGERIEVVVVGAGFAGIAAALAARSAGHDVVMLERADRPGGTWRDNTYPGVACDVPSHLYGLADHLDPGWSAEFAPGAEIQDYLEGIVAALRPARRPPARSSAARRAVGRGRAGLAHRRRRRPPAAAPGGGAGARLRPTH